MNFAGVVARIAQRPWPLVILIFAVISVAAITADRVMAHGYKATVRWSPTGAVELAPP